MTQHLTIVLEYEDDAPKPSIGADTVALGGRVTSFAVGDSIAYLDRIRDWHEEFPGEDDWVEGDDDAGDS